MTEVKSEDTTRRTFLALTTGTPVAGALSKWAGTTGRVIASESLPSHLDKRIPELLERYAIPGACVALVEDGEVTWTGAYGEADLEEGRPMTTNTHLRPESITKSVTAWGVMKLVEGGEIELDDPVDLHITDWDLPHSEYDWEMVTVRRLLSNTAGLPDGIYYNYSTSESIPSLEDALDGNAGAPAARPTSEPGSSFQYSNPGWVLLELLIEAVTGQDFAEYMRAEIMEPLGMETATFRLDEALRSELTTLYTETGEPVPVQREPPKAHGRLYATVDDIAAFVSAGMNGPDEADPGREVLQPETVEAIHSPEVETTGFYGLGSDAYGLGHLVETLPDGQHAVAHGGQGPGSWTWYHSVPETGDGIVILTNSNRSLRFIADIVDEWATRQGFSSVVLSRTFLRVETLSKVSVGALGIVSLGLARRLSRGINSRERTFAPLSPRYRGLRMLAAATAFVVLGLWWGIARPIVDLFLPGLSDWLGAALTVFALLLLTTAMLPRTNDNTDSRRG